MRPPPVRRLSKFRARRVASFCPTNPPDSAKKGAFAATWLPASAGLTLPIPRASFRAGFSGVVMVPSLSSLFLIGFVLALSFAAACSEDNGLATQLILVVDTDYDWPRQADKLAIDVEGPDRRIHSSTFHLGHGDAEVTLPYSMTIVPKNGDATRVVTITTTLYAPNGSILVTKTLRSSFVANKKATLLAFLGRACADKDCNDNETCEDGQCEPIEVVTPDAGPTEDLDAGRRRVDGGSGDDDDACTQEVYYLDSDHDGYGTGESIPRACTVPDGFATNDRDCNDDCPTCHPGAREVCDGERDENCDGHVDEGCTQEPDAGTDPTCSDPIEPLPASERCSVATWDCWHGCLDSNCVNACLASDTTPPVVVTGRTLDCSSCISRQEYACADANGCHAVIAAFSCCIADHHCTTQECADANCSSQNRALSACSSALSETALEECYSLVRLCFPASI